MSVTATAIAQLFKARLEADAQIAAWAQETCGRSLSVFGGASPKRPVKEADAPLVVVDALASERGQVPDLRFTVCVDLGLKRGHDETSLDVKALLEQQFSVHVERVLCAASGNIDFAEIADEFEDSFDPLIVLEKTITVTVPNVMGAVVEL